MSKLRTAIKRVLESGQDINRFGKLLTKKLEPIYDELDEYITSCSAYYKELEIYPNREVKDSFKQIRKILAKRLNLSRKWTKNLKYGSFAYINSHEDEDVSFKIFVFTRIPENCKLVQKEVTVLQSEMVCS